MLVICKQLWLQVTILNRNKLNNYVVYTTNADNLYIYSFKYFYLTLINFKDLYIFKYVLRLNNSFELTQLYVSAYYLCNMNTLLMSLGVN